MFTRMNHWAAQLILPLGMAWIVANATAATIYVNANAAPGGNGSAGAPFNTVQSGINAATNGDTVLVLPGTYADFRANLNGKAITLKSQAGPAATIFDLTWVGSSNYIECNHSETAATVLDGFTIRGGNTWTGGSLDCSNSNPTIRNCVFTQNDCEIYVSNSNSIFENCTFVDNFGLLGGAVWIANTGAPLFKGCVFRHNSPGNTYGAGAVYARNTAAPQLVNCLFVDNYLDAGFTFGGAGAVEADDSAAVTLTNCTLYNNDCPVAGGTIVANTATASIQLVNSILWNNPGADLSGSGLIRATYCNLQEGYAGAGNNNVDPQFMNAAGYDFRLLHGSACVNTGSNAAVPAGVTTDLAGLPRIQESTVDRGAYESQPCVGDLNGDRTVDLSDLALLLSHYGQTGNATPADGDLDGDQDVDLGDLATLLSHYGSTCP